MSLPLNIDDLIHQRKVESARIEYKKDWNPEKVLHSVCAFANDIDNWGGGRSRFYRNRLAPAAKMAALHTAATSAALPREVATATFFKIPPCLTSQLLIN